MKLKLFFISFLLTTGVLLAVIYAHRPKSPRPELVRASDNVFITSQLHPDKIPFLRRRDIRTIVDIRPDGEDKNQTPSSVLETASKEKGIKFYYIPVPHGSIPDSAVTGLGDALSDRTFPTVLYCRTGRRAARLFALAEASRADGPDADAIVEMVRKAGFSADDLRDNITRRIAGRNSASTLEK